MMSQYLAPFGLMFNPFVPDIPCHALYVSAQTENFCQRIQSGLRDGGFAMICGDPGCGKTITLRILAHKLAAIDDLSVVTIDHPQSSVSDFYRQLGDAFGISLSVQNRFAGFKALRSRWADHIASTCQRPVIIIDEAQSVLSPVLNELRILSSKELDSKSLLQVIFAGDTRLPDRFRSDELLPLASRIRRRLMLDYAPAEQLICCLQHLLRSAGNPNLMSPQLIQTLADHAAGNFRIMTHIADELLYAAFQRNCHVLDEKLYLELFASPQPIKKTVSKRTRLNP